MTNASEEKPPVPNQSADDRLIAQLLLSAITISIFWARSPLLTGFFVVCLLLFGFFTWVFDHAPKEENDDP